MKILYNFPTRSRTDKALNCIDNIIYNAKHDDYIILVKIDFDDETMNNDKVIRMLYSRPNVFITIGKCDTKIQAVNRDLPYGYDDIICCHSDDMWFTKEGFDLDILEAFEGFDGLVHFPDQVCGDKLITYPMMTRSYYDRFGYVYHPDYISVYADHHQQEVAKKLGMYKFVDKKILEHRHAIWGFGEPDQLLQKTENPLTYKRDKRTLEYQRSINFGL